jgi:hypothetical protein
MCLIDLLGTHHGQKVLMVLHQLVVGPHLIVVMELLIAPQSRALLDEEVKEIIPSDHSLVVHVDLSQPRVVYPSK